MITLGFIPRFSTLVVTAGILSACNGGFQFPDLGAQLPSNTLPAIERPQPDARGVITYETYQVMVARSGDTLTSMADRVGISSEVLSRYNGLPVGYTPHAGEVLALPENVGGTVVNSPTGWSPEIAASAITNATNNGSGSIGGATPSVGTPNEPLRHRVEAGDTAYSIARLYNVSVTALASWNGLGPDLMVRIGQELIIPVADTQQIANNTAVTPTSTTTPTATPVATAPARRQATVLTATPTPTPTPTQTPAVASPTKFIAPVTGSIIRGYNPAAGTAKSDGIDYAVAAGSPVVAAAAGTVALVSESNGNLGTIVMIRHSNGVISIYGRVDSVSVSKGDSVTRGQQIGVVTAAATPSMHFELRKGTDSVDPALYM